MSKSSDSTFPGDGPATSSSSESGPPGDHDSLQLDFTNEVAKVAVSMPGLSAGDEKATVDATENWKLLTPPGLSGARPWDNWDAEDVPPSPLSKGMLPDVTAPPGLGMVSSAKEADSDQRTMPDPMFDMSSWAAFGQAKPFSDEVASSLDYHKDSTLQVTSMPASKDWKLLFPPSLGGHAHQDGWKDKEPAIICSREAATGEGPIDSEDPALYMNGEEEPAVLQSENELLAAENVRLAMENELLRSKCYMQSGWGMTPDMSPASYWSDQSPMNMDMYGMHSFFPTDAWCGMMPMSGQSLVAGEWQNQWGVSMPPGCNGVPQKGRAARARTDSDIGTQTRGGTGEIGRTRAMSDVSSNPIAPEPYDGPYATVMLRNLPNNYTRSMLLKLIDSEGFAGQYDFIYLPMDFKSHASLGYAFVNLVTAEEAQRFFQTFEGFSRWVVPSQKVCSVNWSHPYQGLEAHIERYRNSPVMHEDVPDDYKPMVFQNGHRVPFPEPTKKLKVPRMRPGHDKASLQDAVQEGEEASA